MSLNANRNQRLVTSTCFYPDSRSQYSHPGFYLELLVTSYNLVVRCSTCSTGNDEHRNSNSHGGFRINFATGAGTTTASPAARVTGALPSCSTTPQPWVAARH